jgi:hypothetical protein
MANNNTTGNTVGLFVGMVGVVSNEDDPFFDYT